MQNYNLEKILDLKKWQNLQDALADMTQLSIITTDYKGNPITTHSRCSAFCSYVREDVILAKRCQKCDSRGGFEAVCTNKPYIYLCHYGIVDIAIPISINEKYVGAIMAGQIKLTDHESLINIEQILSSPTGLTALNSSTRLQSLYNELPTLSYDKIHSVSNMLFHLCNYIVDEAKHKNVLLDMYENLLETESLQHSMNHIKTSLSTAISNTYIDPLDLQAISSKNSALLPVIEHINNHKGSMLSLTEAANLSHLSPGYFSRLFSKEFGQNYTHYLSRLKIEWAKQLLTKTELSITQIADELGFSEPSYFVKIFKKYEQVTPLTYRKYTCE